MRLRASRWLAVVASLALASAAQAADLRGSGGPADPLAPTGPVGFASELPRSPLSDLVVNGTDRFATMGDAQAHCPRDAVVRVEPFSTVYHPAASPGPGVFMCQAAAMAEGDVAYPRHRPRNKAPE